MSTVDEKIDSDEPDVIPLERMGTIDMDLSRLAANEMMKWALTNMSKEGDESGYLIRHGRRPVRDYGCSSHGVDEEDQFNYFEEAFPCLFPYGVGGIEGERV